MDNRDDEEIQPYQFEPEWSPGELDTPEYSDNDTDTSDSSSDLEFGGVEPQGWRLIYGSYRPKVHYWLKCAPYFIIQPIPLYS